MAKHNIGIKLRLFIFCTSIYNPDSAQNCFVVSGRFRLFKQYGFSKNIASSLFAFRVISTFAKYTASTAASCRACAAYSNVDTA
jgi:hypothetical protein